MTDTVIAVFFMMRRCRLNSSKRVVILDTM